MLIRWRPVELEGWERKDTFLGFRDFDFPYLVIGADVPMGSSMGELKAQGRSSFLGIVYAVCRASNDVAAFRQRIRKGQVIEHERVHADYTVPSGQESFTIQRVPYVPDFDEFYRTARAADSRSFAPGSDETDDDHWIFMSCLPWIQFTHVVQPSNHATASIPRYIWGRYHQQDGVWKLPLSIQVHHGLVDGFHVGLLLQRLEALLADPIGTFGC